MSAPVGLALWLQVRDVATEHDRLATAGVTVTRLPRREPWGLVEMRIEDPDGVRIALVVPKATLFAAISADPPHQEVPPTGPNVDR